MSRRLNRRQTYEPPSSCRTVARHLISLHRSAPPRGAGGRRAERLLEADCVLIGLETALRLHRRVLILRGDPEDAMDQANTSASWGRRDHVWEGD